MPLEVKDAPRPRPFLRDAPAKKKMVVCRSEGDFVEAVGNCVNALIKQPPKPLAQIVVTGKVCKTLRWTMPICEFIHNQKITDSPALQQFAQTLPLGELCWILARAGYKVKHNSKRRLAVFPPARTKENNP